MLNKSELHHVCNLDQYSFGRYGDVTWLEEHMGFYVHIDRGSDVLGVAHLDTVQQAKNFRVSKGKVYSPRLDDRLGVYVMLKLLPSLGVKTDILLTTNEEIGKSTALHYSPKKDYNWMYSFDRAGDDVVMYQYYTNEYAELLEEHGFNDVGYGTYSDLSDLDHLGVMGMNVGVGYELYHSVKSYAYLNVLKKNVMRFKSFYDSHKDVHHPHDGQRYSGKYRLLDSEWTKYNSEWSMDDWDDTTGKWVEQDSIVPHCTGCGRNIENDDVEVEAVETYGYCTKCLSELTSAMSCFTCSKDCGKNKYDRFSWIETGECEECAYDKLMNDGARSRFS